MSGAKIGGRVFLTVKRPELRGVAEAVEESGSTIFTLAVLASSLFSLLGSMASWTWRASCNLSSEDARPPLVATKPTFTGSLSLDLARLLANFNIFCHFTALSTTDHCTPRQNMKARRRFATPLACAQVVRALVCCPGMSTTGPPPPSRPSPPVVEEKEEGPRKMETCSYSR